MTPSREEIIALMQAQVGNENLRRHMLATEAIMRALALRLGSDEESWALAGLAHDLDVEQTEDDFTRHGREAAALLRERGAPDDVCHAVEAHNEENTGVKAETLMDIGLIAADQLSGLVTAAALVRPDRSLAGVQVKSLRKRFKETAFARGVDRSSIARCEELGLSLEEFMALGLEAMQASAPELGLG